jgi:hypothetical protein
MVMKLEMFICKLFQLLSAPDKTKVMSGCLFRFGTTFTWFQKTIKLKAMQVNPVSEECSLLLVRVHQGSHK